VPSGGKTETVYDPYDRAVWQRTALGVETGKWTFSKYDALNRVVMSGQTDNTDSRQTLQTQADASVLAHAETRTATGPVYYSLGSTYPAVSEADLRSISYFDDYAHWPAAGMGFDGGNAYHSQYTDVISLPAGMRSRNGTDNTWLASVNYYDSKGRVIQSFSQNLYGQTERTDMEYNFAGEVLKNREAKKNQAGTLTTKIKTYQYDHAGRKTAYQLELGNISNPVIARYEYDEIGRMIQKKIMPDGTYTAGGTPAHIIRPPNPADNTEDLATQSIQLQPGTSIAAGAANTYLAQIAAHSGGTSISGLQTMEYQYHIRGGLRGINLDGSGNPTPNSSQGDLFAYRLDYETGGYFNGNIGKQSWQNTDNNTAVGASRLKSAAYTGVGVEDYSIPNMNYDRNGNITNLQRKGQTGSSYGLMDNLSYSYNGNRLTQITDAVSGNHEVDFVPRSSGNYTFYNDGSLKSDANEQISNILYDSYLQQPIEIQLTDGRKINHYYDGSGKLLKTVYSTGEIWEYVDGFIYKNGALYQVQGDEGRILYQNGAFNYEFQYTDHLGNTRVSFKANGNQLEKVAETAFDPWGVVLNGLGQQNPTQNRWEFLNREKESTFGLNLIRLGERGYNPTNGRFDRVDSKSDVAGQESLTTYQYGYNNPVLQSDPNGDCPKCWEAIKSWLTAPISPEAQNIGQAYMISSTGLDSKPQNRWQLIAAVMGQAGQHFGGSTPGNLKIRIPKSNVAVSVKNNTKLSAPIRRSGPVGVDEGHHNANVRILNDEGKTIKAERVVSGNMTEDEKALGFPLNTLASHTEARAVRNAENQELMRVDGNQMVITGQQAPCPSCKGKMNKLSQESGNTIIYQWRENDETKTWRAKSKN